MGDLVVVFVLFWPGIFAGGTLSVVFPVGLEVQNVLFETYRHKALLPF
mgnify:FL=1